MDGLVNVEQQPAHGQPAPVALGNSGFDSLPLAGNVSLSRIVLGAALFGSTISQQVSFKLMDQYVASGGTSLDTARAFCAWLPGCEFRSEETIGAWMKSRHNRDQLTIVTKGGHPDFGTGKHPSHLSITDIRMDIANSLRTLQLDHVDLYLLHRDDETQPVDDLMACLHQLVLEGKTRAIGVSNWRLPRIIEAQAWIKANGTTALSVSQIQWSLAECCPKNFGDKTLVCMDAESRIGYKTVGLPIMAYTSQAGGLFSAGYRPDLSDIQPKHQKYANPENVRRYQLLLALSAKTGLKPGVLALQYIIHNPLPAVAIIGCSSAEQLAQSLEALTVAQGRGELKLEDLAGLVGQDSGCSD